MGKAFSVGQTQADSNYVSTMSDKWYRRKGGNSGKLILYHSVICRNTNQIEIAQTGQIDAHKREGNQNRTIRLWSNR